MGEADRVQSGIPRLDFILKGGLKRGGTYALMGPPGSGKTILSNHTSRPRASSRRPRTWASPWSGT